MVYIYNGRNITLEWTILKDRRLLEDLTKVSDLTFFLIFENEKKKMDPNDIENPAYFQLGELAEGTYGIEAIWTKNTSDIAVRQGRNIARARVDSAFCVTADKSKAEWATSACVVHVKSLVAVYGYDGLSAYEIAVMRGLTTLSEKAWASQRDTRMDELEAAIKAEALARATYDTNVAQSISDLQTDVSNLKTSGTTTAEYEVDSVPTMGNTDHLITSDGVAQMEAAISERLDGYAYVDEDSSSYVETRLPVPNKPARLNLIFYGGTPPQYKTDYKYVWVEYSDEWGNAFRRLAIAKTQGVTSQLYDEKNLRIDFDLSDYEDWWSATTSGQKAADTPSLNMQTDFSGIERVSVLESWIAEKVKFGNWVSQDKFNVKAYYIDVFRGISTAAYHYVDKVLDATDARTNRIANVPTNTTALDGEGEQNIDLTTEALCHPDGFPVEVYYDGIYQGLRVIELTKDAANYQMNKYTQGHIILDGTLSRDSDTDDSGFFGEDSSTIDWTKFEVRNPKKLYCTVKQDYKKLRTNELDEDGDPIKYDGDDPQELLGWDVDGVDYTEGSIAYQTAQIKDLIKQISTAAYDAYSTYNDNIAGGMDEETAASLARESLEAVFDVKAIMVYLILGNVLYHQDGFSKNWIWTIRATWDSLGNVVSCQAAPNFYDMDSLFGRYTQGTYVLPNSLYGGVGYKNSSTSKSVYYLPTMQVMLFYRAEINAMYAELREASTISVDAIVSTIKAWMQRCGEDAYARDILKHPELPSYRDSGINSAWTFEGLFSYASWQAGEDSTPYFQEGTTYNAGDQVFYGVATQEAVLTTSNGEDLCEYSDGHIEYTTVDENGNYDKMTKYIKGTDYSSSNLNVVTSGSFALFTANEETTAAPLDKTYSSAPYILGMHDGIARIEEWLKQRLAHLDENVFSYTPSTQLTQSAILAIGDPDKTSDDTKASFELAEEEILASGTHIMSIELSEGTIFDLTLIDEDSILNGKYVYARLKKNNTNIKSYLLTPNVATRIVCLSDITAISLTSTNTNKKNSSGTNTAATTDGTVSLLVSVPSNNLWARLQALEAGDNASRSDAFAHNAMVGADASFIFFTDIHKSSTAMARIVAKAEELGVDAIINGGDTVGTYGTESYEWYNSIAQSTDIPILDCVGNHDAWKSGYSNGDFGWLPKATIYNNVIARMVDEGIISSSNLCDTDGLSYYIDINDKVRIVVLTTFSPKDSSIVYWGDTETEWLQNVLDTELPVIVVNHTPLGMVSGVSGVNNPFHTPLRRSSSYSVINQEDDLAIGSSALAIMAATNSPVKLMLHGHLHVDHVSEYSGGEHNVLAFGASTANPAQNGCEWDDTTHIDEYRIEDTTDPSYDCYTLVAIDTTNKIIKLVRYGNTTNMIMANKEQTTFNYD